MSPMKEKTAVIFPSLLLAFAILLVTIFRGADTRYAFSPSSTPTPKPENVSGQINVEYKLVYPGLVMPDNPLWYIKALRDKIQYLLTFNSEKKSELNLLYADKRLQYAKTLFDKEKYDLGYETLTKAEKYLDRAFPEGTSNSEFLNKLANASLKHRQIIEFEIMPFAPEDLKPEINSTADTARSSYVRARNGLRQLGEEGPVNPFESE